MHQNYITHLKHSFLHIYILLPKFHPQNQPDVYLLHINFYHLSLYSNIYPEKEYIFEHD